MKNILSILLLAISFFSCTENKTQFDKILNSKSPEIRAILDKPEQYELQIALSKANKINGSIVFSNEEFRLDQNQYFYPASAVKLPMILFTLEYLNDINASVSTINLDTPYTYGISSQVYSIKQDIKEILAVSDNEAYNRLYELVGRDYVNKRAVALNLDLRLAHRLSQLNADRPGRMPFRFLQNDSIIYEQGIMNDLPIDRLDLKGLKKGKGYIKNDVLINQPFDFGQKNYYPLGTQHELMKRLFYPEAYASNLRFNISDQQMDFIHKTMAAFPHELGYDRKEYYDGYCKFVFFGQSKKAKNKNITTQSKIGYAYGTLCESARIYNETTGEEYILSITLLVNKNGIFNDNAYEYDTLGIPFMRAMGEELLNLKEIE